MQIEHVRARLRANGARSCHEQVVLRAWTQALPLDTGRQRPEDFLPGQLREALPEIATEQASIARLRSTHPGEDGSARLLVELADGQTAQSVLLPRAPRGVDGGCGQLRARTAAAAVA
jgi:23S rRNA (adenine2503-C2)-methyltransferase